MANSPSQRWEDGVMVERAIETNRWKIGADGEPIETEEETTTKRSRKAVSSAKTENKSAKQADDK